MSCSNSTVLCVHNKPLIVFWKTLYWGFNNSLFLFFIIFIPLFMLKDTVVIGYTWAWGCQKMLSHINYSNLFLKSSPNPPQNVQMHISDMQDESKWFRNPCVKGRKRKKITCSYMVLVFQSDQFLFLY